MLGWIDHDAKAREHTRNLLAMFSEEESRDELGIGAIRDSIADALFPGTSTIQTRLKYMLFVPWMYMSLEEKRIRAPRFGQKADEMERDLIEVILQSDDTEGAFGRVSGRKIKRLPSSVYWSGLGSWGIRSIEMSQRQYHEQIDEIYKIYKEENIDPGEPIYTWHKGIPTPPNDFPDRAEFALRSDEALFLRDRIVETHPDSLLAFLAGECRLNGLENVEFAWEHSCFHRFSDENKRLLYHAQNFSEVVFGAVIAYNYYLSKYRFEKKGWENDESLVEEYRERFLGWFGSLRQDELYDWDLNEFWTILEKSGEHAITDATKQFVRAWMDIVLNSRSAEEILERSKTLIKNRERKLKKGKSRFQNDKALEQWGGQSGMAQLDYRWGKVKVLLTDLYKGLEGSTYA
jgi:hypothetical protein